MTDDELGTRLRADASRHRASDALRAAVRTQVALLSAARDGSAAPPPVPSRWTRRVAAAAGFVAGAVLTAALAWLLPPWWQPRDLPAALVAEHVRALRDSASVQVASSDRHTVKPWFQGRLDYAPPVVDLGDDGFPLLGGRIEQRQGTPVAVLVYAARRHVVDLFVWPADGTAAAQREERRGFHLLAWRDGGMQLWAVSDLDAAELDRFADAWRRRRAPP